LFSKIAEENFYERNSFNFIRVHLNPHTIIQLYDDCYDCSKGFCLFEFINLQNWSLYCKNPGISTNLCGECKMTFLVSALSEIAC